MKEIIAATAIILMIISYSHYFRDILRGKTIPHIYSWFIWGLVTAIIFALQLSAGGGAGAFVTLAIAVLMMMIFFLGLHGGKQDITMSDTVFFIISLLAIVLWLFARQPVVSVVLLCSIDLLGFVPTIRKSWRKPYEEAIFFWGLNGFRQALSILALAHLNLITMLYPLVWSGANLLFAGMLIMRRTQLAQAN